MSEGCNNVEVELRPFKHQVGGHMCVLEISYSAICKPFNSKEAWFYNHVTDSLKNFIPTYLGETYVTCNIQNDRKCLVASVPERIVGTDGRLEGDETTVAPSTFQPKKKRRRSHRQNDVSDDGSALEAWSSTCIDRQINRYGFWTNNQPQRFLILENLVHKYNRPCMMDLKMGRRQYGDDSCDEKRKMLESRCAQSTSGSLGFRICGSQVYDIKAGQYICRDKYVGRTLDEAGVVQELSHFFHNGQCIQTEAIRGVLNKLKALKVAMATQKKFRFHSASLLLMYDADSTNQNEINVQGNISRDNTDCKCDCDMKNTDEGLGASSSIKSKDVSCSDDLHTDLLVLKDKSIAESIQNSKPDHTDDQRDYVETRLSEMNGAEIEPTTDVRLIDFAHVSELPNDSSDSNEPICEETISFGLDKLLDILSNIRRSAIN